MSLKFAIEPLDQCWNEFVELASSHWHESMQWQHGKQPFKPEFLRYRQYEQCGYFIEFTARDESTGKMVGHAGMYVTPSMHTQELIASEDFIFLLPEYRRGRNGLRFFQFVEEELKKRGVKEICATAKPDSPASKLMEHLGYSPTNHQYCKHI